MNSSIFRRQRLLAVCVLTLSACGGGSGGPVLSPPPGPSNPPPTGGIERSGIAFGLITGFGSIFVNGVRYDTATSAISIDGNAASESDLSVGDVVLVTGTIDASGLTGTAETVNADHIVKGLITSLALAAGSFVVLGQTVRTDSSTLFDDSIMPNSLDGLLVGDIVEVSGFVGAGGEIVATRIETKAVLLELELTGVVSALDAGNGHFEINGQVVDFSNAPLVDFPVGGIADGDLVEVKATMLNAANELVAIRVELKDDDFDVGDDGDGFEVEGLVTRFVSATDFDVAGFAATTDAQTVYENGVAGDLALGIKVEIEGSLDSNGVVVADKVDFRPASNLRIEGVVDSVAADSLVVLGVTVLVDEVTRFEDSSLQDDPVFALAKIVAGNFIEVRGSENSAGPGIVAALIERDDDGDTKIRGPVESFAEPMLTILGVTIETNAATQFEDVDETPLSAVDFFAMVAAGSLVSAEGSEVATTTLLAEEVEFEDD